MRTNVCSRFRWFWAIPLGIIVIIAIGYLTMLLWNALIPEIFHLPSITFLQSIGLLVLFRILFGRMGRHHGRHHRWGHHDRGDWDKYTPEEKQKMFRHWNHHSYFCQKESDKTMEENQGKS